MPSGRTVTFFAIKLLVIYGALSAGWLLYGPAYSYFVRESGNLLFEATGADHVRIRAGSSASGTNDIELFVRDVGGAPLNSMMLGFQTVSILMGLIVATPVPARRRVWAILLGLVLAHAFVLTRLIALAFIAPHLNSFTIWGRAIRWSVAAFIHGQAASCFVPILIWIALTIRKEDVKILLGPGAKSHRRAAPSRR